MWKFIGLAENIVSVCVTDTRQTTVSLKLNFLVQLQNINKMGCPALGVLVAFFKQPDALPGRAPQINKRYIFFELLLTSDGTSQQISSLS
jgi:hypothetical protein